MTTSSRFLRGHRAAARRAVARVRLLAGEGEVVVNGRTLEEHFGNAVSLSDILMPFRVTGTEGRYNAMVKVEGGGHRRARPAPSATASPAPCSSPTPRLPARHCARPGS